ncbi:MAG: carboxypeptidase-like regulatory domain-containing protein, partial [Bacteroidota bacterium]
MRFLRLVAFMGLILGTSVAFGQDELLRGQIIDGVSRQPLIGATVQIRGTSRGSVTDEKGGFELEVALLPLALRISYVGYEIKEVTIDRLQEGRIVIALLPKSETLDEVVVSAEAIVTPITDTERYSVVDFIIAEQFILTLEFHGTFKDYRMTVHDLDGKARYITVLNDINQIEGLYRSCNDHAYLLTELDAFELRLGQDSLTVQQIHERATFETLVRPCKAVQDSMAYYVFEQAQGLVRIVKSFNTNTQKSKRLRTIADQDQISNAMMDLSLIVNGATINPIMYQDDEDVKIARAMQAESDFLRRVFYKPEYPVYLFGSSQQVYLLNHPNKQL